MGSKRLWLWLSAGFCLAAINVWAWPAPLTNKPTVDPVLIKSTPYLTIGNPSQPAPYEKTVGLNYILQNGKTHHQLLRNWGSEKYSGLAILVKNDKIYNPKVEEFVRTLAFDKKRLMRVFGLSNREYNRLAVLSFGALGNESKFYSSAKYFAKETLQPGIVAVKFGKKLWENDIFELIQMGQLKVEPNSRGPTQIKYIPAKLVEEYAGENIKPSTLTQPRHAALVTMGYMAEALYQMRRHVRNNKLDFISEQNIYDYLPYIYFGKVKRVVNGTATPWAHQYISSLKENIQWIELFEEINPSKESGDYQ